MGEGVRRYAESMHVSRRIVALVFAFVAALLFACNASAPALAPEGAIAIPDVSPARSALADASARVVDDTPPSVSDAHPTTLARARRAPATAIRSRRSAAAAQTSTATASRSVATAAIASDSVRATVRFVIERTGAVSSSRNEGSTLGDAVMIQCVVREFARLDFPRPEDGADVTVKYSVDFLRRLNGPPMRAAPYAPPCRAFHASIICPAMLPLGGTVGSASTSNHFASSSSFPSSTISPRSYVAKNPIIT